MYLDFAKKINFNFRKRLFRREVETTFYSNKKFSLPRISSAKGEVPGHFKTSYPLSFIASSDEIKLVRNELLRLESKEQILAYADIILENKFLLYGEEISIGEKVNWSKDYISGYEWSKELTWKKDYFSFPKGTDIKNVWELGRFNQAILLGKAYLISSDEKYVSKYKELFYSFLNENPFCASVHWTDSSEVSIRLINFAFAFSFFLYSPGIDDKFINDFRDAVLQHSVFIENNLHYKFNRGSCYLLNLLALSVTGILFKENHYGIKLVNFAFSNLEFEIRNQVHKDGVTFEQSLQYHAISLEAFYLAKIIRERNGGSFSGGYDEILYDMFEVHSNYLRDDFSLPQIGDSVTGRIVPFNVNDMKLNFAYPLAMGAFLFNEGMFKRSSPEGSAELLFLFGLEYKKKYDSLPKARPFFDSKGYSDGGHYIIRTPQMHLFIEAGEIGNRGEGAPGHNDIFSFDLFYNHKEFIVDPGTYSFYADPEIRNRLRSVRSHNSVSIDNELLTKFDGLFKIKDDLTKPKILEWKSDNEEDTLTIQHYAYTRFVDPVICKRTFKFMKYKNILKIKDEIFGGADHTASANLIFNPDVQLNMLSENVYSASIGSDKIELRMSSPSDYFFTSVQDTEYSSRYGKLDKTKKISIYLKDKLPAFFITEIILL